jgi:hypothetical protein
MNSEDQTSIDVQRMREGHHNGHRPAGDCEKQMRPGPATQAALSGETPLRASVRPRLRAPRAPFTTLARARLPAHFCKSRDLQSSRGQRPWSCLGQEDFLRRPQCPGVPERETRHRRASGRSPSRTTGRRQPCRDAPAKGSGHFTCVLETLPEPPAGRNRKLRPGCAETVHGRDLLWKV